MYAKFKTVCALLLKGSQFYYYSNTVFDTFVPGMDWGITWLEVLEPDKNEWHATNGDKQMKLFNCPYYIVQYWESMHTLNSSLLQICRYRLSSYQERWGYNFHYTSFIFTVDICVVFSNKWMN